MVNHILIGVDGSKESLEAARFGQGLAEQTGAAVTYLFAIEPPQVIPVGPLSGYVTTSAPRSEEDLIKARQFLDALVAERPALKAATRVELGKPSETLCEVANQLGVDLVIVGARGQGAGRRFILGSVSDRVVHHAPCPVLVVRPTSAP
jgi:nucleotide-binding universal stress UspA family protein